MSQDIGDTLNPRVAGCFALLGLVVAGGVEGEFADERSGRRVGDSDVKIIDDDRDAGSGVGSSDADVVESPGVAQGEFAVLIDGVVADAVVAGASGVRGGLGPGLVGGVGCAPVEGSVGPGGVVVVAE